MNDSFGLKNHPNQIGHSIPKRKLTSEAAQSGLRMVEDAAVDLPEKVVPSTHAKRNC